MQPNSRSWIMHQFYTVLVLEYLDEICHTSVAKQIFQPNCVNRMKDSRALLKS
jgi:hypothetical protein